VHNVLEAAVYSKPVFFGPGYQKYAEAKGLVKAAGAFPVEGKDEFIAHLNNFILHPDLQKEAGLRSGYFVNTNTGAVEKILSYIQEKRLLTN
jgi:3-deoxy-D-manno-octulosonic-acid transferase